MTLQGIKELDIVKCDVKGRVFHAFVEGKEKQKLKVKPIENGITYREASAREVIGHWRRRKNGK